MPDKIAPSPQGAASSRKEKPVRDGRGRIQIDLALQGGGSHGAFTWGVLDRLLEVETMEIAAISGTSAGAMNAVAVAAGLMDGGASLKSLGGGSKSNTQWAFLSKLHGLGRAAAQNWLAQHDNALGRHSSFDLTTLL